jgi:hypothetical protein
VFGHSHIPWDSTTPGGMRLSVAGSSTWSCMPCRRAIAAHRARSRRI